MRRIILVVFAFSLAVTAAEAQFRSNVNQNPRPQRQQNSNPEFRRVYFGGGGSLGFGTGYNYYSVFPIVGYRLTEDFSLGTGITYQRYNYSANYSISGQGYAFTQYGITPFARYNVSPVFFQTELDVINSPGINYYNGEPVRKNFTRFLVGIGYMSQIGSSGRGAFNILAMYDLLYKAPSVFASPIVLRVFVTF